LAGESLQAVAFRRRSLTQGFPHQFRSLPVVFRVDVLYPPPSSTRTIGSSGYACRNAVRNTSRPAPSSHGSYQQKLAPVAGSTAAYHHSPSYRSSNTPGARNPRGHQRRRNHVFRPNRASSNAHTRNADAAPVRTGSRVPTPEGIGQGQTTHQVSGADLGGGVNAEGDFYDALHDGSVMNDQQFSTQLDKPVLIERSDNLSGLTQTSF